MPFGEFSRRTGCAIETVRFYEKIGILPKPWRRDYEAGDVGRVVLSRTLGIRGND
jgi:MerR family mercuric resistance operon transcriptional regulator